MRSRARYRRAGVAQGDPRRRAGFWARPGRGWGGGSCKSPATRGWPPCPLKGKPLSGDRYHPGAADCPRPGPRAHLRGRPVPGGPGGQGSGPRAKGRTQAGMPRTAVQATRASHAPRPARSRPSPGGSKPSSQKASFAPAAEWEGGGPARAPPRRPRSQGQLHSLALTDGYQLASASLSRLPRLPSLLCRTAGSILAAAAGKRG